MLTDGYEAKTVDYSEGGEGERSRKRGNIALAKRENKFSRANSKGREVRSKVYRS